MPAAYEGRCGRAVEASSLNGRVRRANQGKLAPTGRVLCAGEADASRTERMLGKRPLARKYNKHVMLANEERGMEKGMQWENAS